MVEFEQNRTTGEFLQRAEPLEIARSLIIEPNKRVGVSFALRSDNLPLNGKEELSDDILDGLGVHVRTRYAHLGLHLEKDSLIEALKRLGGVPRNGKKAVVKLPVMNYGSRPVRLNEGSRMFHSFFTSESMCIRGKELESMVGSNKEKPVYFQGEEGEDWKLIYNDNAGGATALLLRIQDWYYIPESKDIVDVSGFGNFEEFRAWFDKNAVQHQGLHLDASNHVLIGKGSRMILFPDIYLKLSSVIYREDDRGKFEDFATQTSSPLLEGFRTKHRPHFEAVGRSWQSLEGKNWIGATLIRNGHLATAG